MRIRILLLALLLPALASALSWGAVFANASGNRYYAKENYQQAEQTWSRLAASRPKDGRAQYNYGCALYRLNKLDEALARFQLATADKHFREVTRAWQNIGRIHAERQEYREAYVAYKNALVADPANADARRDLELVARQLVTLAGVVKDADTGAPLPGVTLRLVEQSEPPVTNAPDGSFMLHWRCMPGQWTVEAVCTGYVTVRKRIDAGVGRDWFTIPMERVIVVRGMVKDADTGAPIAKAVVSARGVDAPPDTTAADGTFTLSGFATRSYAFEAQAPGYLNFSEPLPVSRAASTLTLQMRPAKSLRGVVTNLYTGKPVPNAELSAMGSDAAPAVTDSLGAYVLDGLDRKTYTINVFATDYVEQRVAVAVQNRDQRWDVRLKPGLPLTGRVLDADTGNPLEGATVRVDSSAIAASTTGADGRYSLKGFDEQTYVILAAAPGHAAIGVPVSVDRNHGTHDIRLPRAFEVSGLVTDAANGAEIVGENVRVPGLPIAPDTTGASGFYRLDGFEKGE